MDIDVIAYVSMFVGMNEGTKLRLLSLDFIERKDSETFYKVLTQSTVEIQDMISHYYYAKRGKIHSLIIEKNSIAFNGESSGRFVVRYNINYTQGCQDLTYDEDEKMTIDFTV